MLRSMQTITGVSLEELYADGGKYSPDQFDAIEQEDGTFNLVPLMWTNQSEFMEYAFGTGNQD